MLEVLDLAGSGRFAVPSEGMAADLIEVLDLERRPAGDASLHLEDGRLAVRGPPGPHLYRIALARPPGRTSP